MHVIVPNLPQTIPVDPSPPNPRRRNTTFDVRVPANDPCALSLLPGQRVTLVTDDGTRHKIALGKNWTSHREGMIIRIPYVESDGNAAVPAKAAPATSTSTRTTSPASKGMKSSR